jgi:membrane protein implicated in regulation of membrane protease activity
MERPDRRVILKYALVQVPGILAAAVIAAALHRWLGLPLPAAIAGVFLWVIKDISMFFVTWKAYADTGTPGSSMTGREGEALEQIAPTGRVSIRGENWSARLAEGTAAIEKGSPVIVVDMDGLTLVVSPGRPGRTPP